MDTGYGHLSYCTNIHTGESWQDHFTQLQLHIPQVKQQIAANQPFGIGLRLSNLASLELRKAENLNAFQQWLRDNNCYVFTMNGFPYGGFHHTRVKDAVHAPDWTTSDRVQYTIRLAQLMAALLPEGNDGGISTSPLSYAFWHEHEVVDQVFERATFNLLEVVAQLMQIRDASGKMIHLDIEPEPDGLLGESASFFDWYEQYLLPLGTAYLSDRFEISVEESEQRLKEHVQLCYDVCHVAINYEDHAAVFEKLKRLGIRIGKIQISAAPKASFAYDSGRQAKVMEAFQAFNESTYLHQVVAKQEDGSLKRYPDMPEALRTAADRGVSEWRAHFHVPLFVEDYGVLQSTQNDIRKVLSLHLQEQLTAHLEVETYTWEVLPDAMRLPLTESIVRELQFVLTLLAPPPGTGSANKSHHA